jgi:hypothetical protein
LFDFCAVWNGSTETEGSGNQREFGVQNRKVSPFERLFTLWDANHIKDSNNLQGRVSEIIACVLFRIKEDLDGARAREKTAREAAARAEAAGEDDAQMDTQGGEDDGEDDEPANDAKTISVLYQSACRFLIRRRGRMLQRHLSADNVPLVASTMLLFIGMVKCSTFTARDCCQKLNVHYKPFARLVERKTVVSRMTIAGGGSFKVSLRQLFIALAASLLETGDIEVRKYCAYRGGLVSLCWKTLAQDRLEDQARFLRCVVKHVLGNGKAKGVKKFLTNKTRWDFMLEGGTLKAIVDLLSSLEECNSVESMAGAAKEVGDTHLLENIGVGIHADMEATSEQARVKYLLYKIIQSVCFSTDSRNLFRSTLNLPLDLTSTVLSGGSSRSANPINRVWKKNSIMNRTDISAAKYASAIWTLTRLCIALRSNVDLVQRQLLLNILAAHPNMYPLFLKSFPFSLEPRPSPIWEANVDLVMHLLLLPKSFEHMKVALRKACFAAATAMAAGTPESGSSENTASSGSDNNQDMQSIFTSLFFPHNLARKEFSRGLQHADASVRSSTVQLLHTELHRFEIVSTYLDELYVSEKAGMRMPKQTVLKAIASAMLQRLPDVQILIKTHTRYRLELEKGNPPLLPLLLCRLIFSNSKHFFLYLSISPPHTPKFDIPTQLTCFLYTLSFCVCIPDSH